MSFTITSNPLAALGDAALLTGVERIEADDLRLYVGARYLSIYVVVPAGERADAIERVWKETMGHLWMTPAPPTEYRRGVVA